MKILVVDDSSTMRRIIINVLKQLGFSSDIIYQAENGREGLEKYKEHKPNLILLDINMPEMNGLDLLKEIRKINEESHIIMVTTEGGKDMVLKALKAKANNYIIKPFTSEILKSKIKIILEEGI